MGTGVRNHSTEIPRQKIGTARNPAPTTRTPLVLIRAHLSMRLVLVEVTSKSVANHESVISGWRRASPIFCYRVSLNIGIADRWRHPV
jgi:hypothetical protein